MYDGWYKICGRAGKERERADGCSEDWEDGSKGERGRVGTEGADGGRLGSEEGIGVC